MNKNSSNILISKVRDIENIGALLRFTPRYISFDFRHSSPYYLGEVDEALFAGVPPKVSKVGIFEESSTLYISYIAGRFLLNAIQLEGDVSLKTCEILAAEGLEILKTITSEDEFDKFEGVCNKFLVNDPALLARYRGKTPLIVDSSLYRAGCNYIANLSENFDERVALKNIEKIEDWTKHNI